MSDGWVNGGFKIRYGERTPRRHVGLCHGWMDGWLMEGWRFGDVRGGHGMMCEDPSGRARLLSGAADVADKVYLADVADRVAIHPGPGRVRKASGMWVNLDRDVQ